MENVNKQHNLKPYDKNNKRIMGKNANIKLGARCCPKENFLRMNYLYQVCIKQHLKM